MMDLNEFFSNEVPHEAESLIQQFEMAVAELRQVTEQRTTRVRQTMEEKVATLREQAEEEIAGLDHQADQKVTGWLRELLAEVRPLQEKYLRAGQLDAALALRERVRQLRGCVADVRPDPGCFSVSEEDMGKTFYFEVTGSTDGSVYGTDVYTTGASLASAAVHAGALAAGEKGIVRVTVLGQRHANFTGSHRHGISSYDYSSPYTAFRVSRA